MKTYRTDWKIAIIFLIGLAIWAWGIGGQAPNRTVYINAVLMATVIFTTIILLTMWLSYAMVSDNTLKFVYLLFYRRTIDIHSITAINDQPTYKGAKGVFRSLYIFYKDRGLTKYIELRITIFPEKTLGELIKELKRINPHIELNKYSQKLMDTAS